MKAIKLAVLGVLIAMSAQAVDENGRYSVQGSGGISCEKYVTAYDAGGYEHSSHVVYIAGYVTAVNEWHPQGIKDLMEGTDLAGVRVWIRNYCIGNPLNNFADALTNLTAELLYKRQ